MCVLLKKFLDMYFLLKINVYSYAKVQVTTEFEKCPQLCPSLYTFMYKRANSNNINPFGKISIALEDSFTEEGYTIVIIIELSFYLLLLCIFKIFEGIKSEN